MSGQCVLTGVLHLRISVGCLLPSLPPSLLPSPSLPLCPSCLCRLALPMMSHEERTEVCSVAACRDLLVCPRDQLHDAVCVHCCLTPPLLTPSLLSNCSWHDCPLCTKCDVALGRRTLHLLILSRGGKVLMLQCKTIPALVLQCT